MGYSSRCTRPSRHGERQIIEKHLIGHVTLCDTALIRFLPDLSRDKREEEHAEDYPQSNYPEECWSTGPGESGGFTAVW